LTAQRGNWCVARNASTVMAARAWCAHCTRRIFAKSCAVKEKFACGMVGRMLYESAKTPDDYARVRANLEQSCTAVKGFPCRVLAKYLEDGKLGIYEPGQIFELLARACEGGDKNACGSPATANETFD
jgi:hypothetical protein